MYGIFSLEYLFADLAALTVPLPSKAERPHREAMLPAQFEQT